MTLRAFAMLLLTALGGTALVGLSASRTQSDDIPAPGLFATDRCSLAVVDHTFVTELAGETTSYKAPTPETYRGIVVTLKITKPANEATTLHAQDVPLHYRYGAGQYDVANCIGLSSFSGTKDADRPIDFSQGSYLKRSTGVSTTKASTVYIDAFYGAMEPTVSEFEVLVAQPVGARSESRGWTP